MSDAPNDDNDDNWVRPETAPAADLPVHARERLTEMRSKRFFTSDLSVNEFLLVKECGFDPLGLVMGSSIYQIKPQVPGGMQLGELESMTTALYHARELAMTRMEEEADALGADGIVAVKLEINLHAWGTNVAEFIAVGTAVRHRGGASFRNHQGKPFQSDLSGQDFWTLLKSGFRPVGFVMGNCVYYVGPSIVRQGISTMAFGSATNPNADYGGNREVVAYTHALYDARELAIERLQEEAYELQATGIVGVTVEEKQHSWRSWLQIRDGNTALRSGELIEFFVFGTAVVPIELKEPIPVPTLVIAANT